MSFGLVNGPAIFQRLINSVLGSLRFTVAMAYMDDVLIPSSVEEGLANLEQILAVFRRVNLKLNLKKCYFFYENIDYLGFQISAKGSEWIWGNEQEAAFEKLKQELAGDNVLILYSHEAYTKLHTINQWPDASSSVYK
ncbi:Reverse transcriptase (RNA-dependent DNA polymerase) [Popillia japonica]|uniref:Reverse transcriptase (RNA-dependent DNA polymerase) n=1 Tax=Popillia japonica TaxID=7064 RepID=A0AAW1LSL0_POPJA